ncbi:MAG: Ribosomal large subunit pseudouridine synthase D [Cryomorphaceae bacterium]|nr:MAG: Ribosomal large subunit pseudouridine synthase D [Cryomorphaceae bacterium]
MSEYPTHDEDVQLDEIFVHHRLVAEEGQELLRVDKFLLNQLPDTSRTRIQKAAEAGTVTVNGKVVKSSFKVKAGDAIEIVLGDEPRDSDIRPEELPLEIVHRDEHVIVLNKAPGMVCHPGHGNYTGTLVHGLAFLAENLPIGKQGEERPGLVHRLDKDTSGVMVAAASELGMSSLAKQFYDRTTSREYVAIVWGDLEQEEGTIEGHIGRSMKDRLQMAVFPDGSEGKHAVTHYKVLQRFGYVTVVSCKLETGRTHQIRAHMRFLGHPLFNDERYGGDKILKGTSFSKYRQFIMNCFKACPRHALHAKTLGFTHPQSGEHMSFDTVIPEDMMEVIRKFENYTKSGPTFSEQS